MILTAQNVLTFVLFVTQNIYFPSLPKLNTEIFVEFVDQNFTVSEADGNVTVTVRATGFPSMPFDAGDSISVFLFTVDGSAEGKFYIIVPPIAGTASD